MYCAALFEYFFSNVIYHHGARFAGGSLLESLHMVETTEAGEKKLEGAISNGSALKHFRQMLLNQGASVGVVDVLCRFEDFPELDIEYDQKSSCAFIYSL